VQPESWWRHWRSLSSRGCRRLRTTPRWRSWSPPCSDSGRCSLSSPSSPPGIQDLLFGDILGVSNADLLFAAGAAVAALGALRLLHGQLLAVGFDRDGARALGASPALAETALLILIALAVLIGVQGLGNLLVVAVLIGPAATARLICTRLLPMMGVAAGVAILGGAIGLYVSYYAGTAAGASVAGALVALFLLTAIASATSGRSAEVAPVSSRLEQGA